jgi:hypothetical protein
VAPVFDRISSRLEELPEGQRANYCQAARASYQAIGLFQWGGRLYAGLNAADWIERGAAAALTAKVPGTFAMRAASRSYSEFNLNST